MVDSTEEQPLPSEPGSVPDESMEFEEAPDAPPASEMPENDQELGDAEPQETEEDVDDGEA